MSTHTDPSVLRAGDPDVDHPSLLAERLSAGDLADASGFEAMSLVLRSMGASGVFASRQYNTNTPLDPATRKHDGAYAALNLHDHSNYMLMCGLAEFSVIVNGWPYASRHQDYRWRRSVPADEDTLGTEYTRPPEVPASIASKPLGLSGNDVNLTDDTQMRAFSRIFEDHPEQVEMHLAYLELWWEKTDGELRDAGDSFRHSDSVDDLHAQYDKAARLAATGGKELTENLPFGPVAKRYIEGGIEKIAYLNARMMTCKVGTMAPSSVHQLAPIVTIQASDSHGHILPTQMTDEQARQLRDGEVGEVILTSTDVSHVHEYRITWDGDWYVGVDTNATHQHGVLIERGYDGALPYDRAKALAGIVDDGNVFSLIDDPIARGEKSIDDWERSRWPRFRIPQLERICERVPGLDGEGSFINEVSILDPGQIMVDRDGGVLNAAYYSHTFGQSGSDASGRRIIGRGYNDPAFFRAATNKSFVLDGSSYMVPIEMLALSHINGANPYNFSVAEEAVTRASGNGTAVEPYGTISEASFWYIQPAGLYVPTGEVDPADTGPARYVRDPGGSPRLVYAGGIAPHTPDKLHRIRFPCYPIYQEYTWEAVRLAHLRRELSGGGTSLKVHSVSAAGEAYGSAALVAAISDVPGQTGERLHVTGMSAPAGKPTTARYYWGAVSDGAGGSTPGWIDERTAA